MKRTPIPRGPFSGPLRASHTTHPSGGSLVENRDRAYLPSWAMVPRTTWTNALGGHHGLCGRLAGTWPPAGATPDTDNT